VALTALGIDPASIAASGFARVDPRYHHLRSLSAPLLRELREPVPFKQLARFENGLNLPRTTYADTEEQAVALYASVGAFPLYVLRRDGCVPLRGDPAGAIAGTGLAPMSCAVRANEVLITRSRASAPGVAWPGDLAPPELPVIPAGFLIRASLCDAVQPGFVAAVLNHPAWRLLTAALAAGKSQDNLGQEVLGEVPLPRVSLATQTAIADGYRDALVDITALFERESELAGVCDQVIAEQVAIPPPTPNQAGIRPVHVSPTEIAATRALRLDNRWHSPENRDIRAKLLDYDLLMLGDVLDGLPAKGRQPRWAPEESVSEDTPRAIATASIQSGTIALEQTRPTTEQSVARFPVHTGDLLIAMDGDGSLGKAAVYEGESDATVDSHVARCRTRGDSRLADALACYLNSSWGRVQTTSLMTGATGQTQLSPSDLRDVLVPSELVARASSVSGAYRDALRAYEPFARRARRTICRASAEMTSLLLADGALAGSRTVERFADPDFLLAQLTLLHPSVRGHT
jgi:hypothetical protein